MGKFFYNIHKVLSGNRWISFVSMLLLFTVLAFIASRIHFEEDITKLIPVKSETEDLQKVLQTVSFADNIVVNIHRDEGAEVDSLISYANDFIDSLETHASLYVKHIQGKVDEEDFSQMIDFVYENLPLFLDDKDYELIANKLEADSLEKILQANYRSLISLSGIVSRETILKDPLGISFIALSKLRQLDVTNDFKLRDGYLISNDEKNILLFISPEYSSSETAENGKFVEQLFYIQDKLNAKYEEQVNCEYFGAAIIAVENANQIRRDIQFTVGITLSILILILILYYRRLYIPLILFVSPAFGVLLAMATLSMMRTEVSAISLGIGSILIGVTLDYSIHILTHIRNNQSLKSLFKDITEPILMSSLTTSLAFMCLLLLKSQAIQDLGIFAAVSVFGAAIFALLFIPLVYKNPTNSKNKINVLDKIARYSFHKKKGVWLGIAALIIVSFYTYDSIGFDKDISKLNFESQESQQALKNLEELTDLASKSVYIVSYGESLESALQLNDSIYEELILLKDKKELSSFNSISTLVKSKAYQKEKIKRWEEFWDENKVYNTREQLIEVGKEIGFKPSSFNKFYDLLQTDFSPLAPEDYHVASSMLIDEHINTKGDFTTVTTLIKLTEGDIDVDNIKANFKDYPNTLLLDRKAMNESFLDKLKNDFHTLIALCLIVVLVVLAIFFRRVALSLVTITPIFLTWFFTLGIMGILGISFNIFNIIIATVVFGLGIDYSIFMTKGLLKKLKTGEKVMITYKTSIMLSVLTTILGVGVLVFAKHPVLFSVSIVSVIGILSAMFNAFTVQPLLFRIFIGSKTQTPINLRVLLYSIFSFGCFGIGAIFLSLFSMLILPLLPLKKQKKELLIHKLISPYMKFIFYTNPFVKKQIINPHGEDFSKPAIIIANHTSFLDILAVGILHPKILFFVNDWVYNSPIFGRAIQKANFFPVSNNIQDNLSVFKEKVEQGYLFMIFPEGTRSTTHKIRRFHKGAFFLAEELELDILPILIHGNPKVNPKGSFIINDGDITLKVLPRIPYRKDNSINYSARTKQKRASFQAEFAAFRKELEGPTYFHKLVLNQYKYKDDVIYKIVKEDLKRYAEAYYQLIWNLDSKAKILHLSEDYGQLEFLLTLDGPDRRVSRLIRDEEVKQMLEQTYLTNKYQNIEYFTELENLSLINWDTLILSSSHLLKNIQKTKGDFLMSFKTIVLLKEATLLNQEDIFNIAYKSIFLAAEVEVYKNIDKE